jgi:hypothetical protein
MDSTQAAAFSNTNATYTCTQDTVELRRDTPSFKSTILFYYHQFYQKHTHS